MKDETHTSKEEEIIRKIVTRFLSWKLPENFHPDAGISFKAEFNENTDYPMKHKPSGTNLFNAQQATEMVKYIIANSFDEIRQEAITEEREIISKLPTMRINLPDGEMGEYINKDLILQELNNQ